MYFIIGLDKAAECERSVFEKHLDVSEMHLDVYDIHLKIALNSHAHYLFKPRRVKELWTRQTVPFKD